MPVYKFIPKTIDIADYAPEVPGDTENYITCVKSYDIIPIKLDYTFKRSIVEIDLGAAAREGFVLRHEPLRGATGVRCWRLYRPRRGVRLPSSCVRLVF